MYIKAPNGEQRYKEGELQSPDGGAHWSQHRPLSNDATHVERSVGYFHLARTAAEPHTFLPVLPIFVTSVLRAIHSRGSPNRQRERLVAAPPPGAAPLDRRWVGESGLLIGHISSKKDLAECARPVWSARKKAGVANQGALYRG